MNLWNITASVNGNPPPVMVIAVGFEPQYALSFFKEYRRVGRVTNSCDVKNEETTNHTGLYGCSQPRQSWPEMWANMKWYQ